MHGLVSSPPMGTKGGNEMIKVTFIIDNERIVGETVVNAKDNIDAVWRAQLKLKLEDEDYDDAICEVVS